MKRSETTLRASATLPDPPLHIPDRPDELPAIGRLELAEYLNAKYVYDIAKADFERKRAEITLKLLQGCEPDPDQDSFSAHLDEAGNLVVTDSCSEGPPIIVR